MKIISNDSFSPESIRTFFVSDNAHQSIFITKKLIDHLNNPDEYIRVLFTNLSTTRKGIILSILCAAQNNIESIAHTFNFINEDINSSKGFELLNEEIHILDEGIIKIDDSGEFEEIKFYHPTMVEYLIAVIKEPSNSLFRKTILKNINSSVLNLSYLFYSNADNKFVKNIPIGIKITDFENLAEGIKRYLINPTNILNQVIEVINWFKSMNMAFIKVYDKAYSKKVKSSVNEIFTIVFDTSFYHNHENESIEVWSEFLFSLFGFGTQYALGRDDLNFSYYDLLLKQKRNESGFWKLVFRIAIFIEGDIVLSIISKNWLDEFITNYKNEIYSLGNELFEDDFPNFEKYEELKKQKKHYGKDKLKNKPNKEYYPRYIVCKEKYDHIKVLKWNIIGQRTLNQILVPFEVLFQHSEHAKNFHYHNKFMLDDDLVNYYEQDDWEYLGWESESPEELEDEYDDELEDEDEYDEI